MAASAESDEMDEREMCSRPTMPPMDEARMADSPPMVSKRDPMPERRTVV